LFENKEETIERMENENRFGEVDVGYHRNWFKKTGVYWVERVDVFGLQIDVKNCQIGKSKVHVREAFVVLDDFENLCFGDCLCLFTHKIMFYSFQIHDGIVAIHIA
jgi:hypothetical protein